MADEQVIVEIKVESDAFKEAEKNVDKLIDSIEELTNRIADAKKQNKAYKEEQDKLNKSYEDGKISVEKLEKKTDALNKKISANNKLIAETTIEKQKENKALKANINLLSEDVNLYDKLSKELNKSRKEAKNLGLQWGKNSTQFKKAQANVLKLDKKLKAVDNAVGQNQRSVGKYTNALKGMGSQLVGSLGITGGITAVIAGFQAFSEKATLLTKVTNKIVQTFGLARNEAKKLSNDVVALASNFDEDYNRVLIATNAVSKEFGISAAESLALIEEGFKKGSDNSGEFLDILREYPVFLKKAGLSAAESFAIINQQVTAGVYSDKGIDAIKEADLALRENTKTTKAALSVLSDSVQEQIAQEVAAGNTFKAMQLISTEMKTAGLTASETGAIMADVFKGAGEDSASFVMNLDEVELSLAGVANQTSIVEDANLRMDSAWNNFVSSVDNGGGIISTVTAGVKNSFSDLLDDISDLNDGTATWLDTIKRSGILGAGFKAEANAAVIARKAIKETNKENVKEIDVEIEAREKQLAEFKKQQLENKKITREAAEFRRSSREKEALSKKEAEKAEKERIQKAADEKIRIIEETSARELEILNATNAEKKFLQIGSFVDIAKIRKEESDDIFNAFEKNKQGIAEEFEFKKEFEDKERELRLSKIEDVRSATQELNAIAAEFAGELSGSFGFLTDSIFNAFEDGKLTVENTLSLIASATNVVFSAIKEKQNQQLANLETQKEKEIELSDGSEAAKLAIEEKFSQQSNAIKKKQFNIEKAAALTQIATQTAIAVTKSIAASPLTGGLPFSAIVGALGVAQGAIVAAKKPPKFGGGTSDIVNIGDSHASGRDTKVFGVSGGQTQFFGSVEKGERMPVIRESAANDSLVSQLNGRGRQYANGTNDILNGSNVTNNNGISAEEVKAIVKNMPPIYTQVEDVTKAITRKAEIVDGSKV